MGEMQESSIPPSDAHTSTHPHLKPFTVQNVSSHLQHRRLSHTTSVCQAEVLVYVCVLGKEERQGGVEGRRWAEEGGVSLREDRGVQLDLM